MAQKQTFQRGLFCPTPDEYEQLEMAMPEPNPFMIGIPKAWRFHFARIEWQGRSDVYYVVTVQGNQATHVFSSNDGKTMCGLQRDLHVEDGADEITCKKCQRPGILNAMSDGHWQYDQTTRQYRYA